MRQICDRCGYAIRRGFTMPQRIGPLELRRDREGGRDSLRELRCKLTEKRGYFLLRVRLNPRLTQLSEGTI